MYMATLFVFRSPWLFIKKVKLSPVSFMYLVYIDRYFSLYNQVENVLQRERERERERVRERERGGSERE